MINTKIMISCNSIAYLVYNLSLQSALKPLKKPRTLARTSEEKNNVPTPTHNIHVETIRPRPYPRGITEEVIMNLSRLTNCTEVLLRTLPHLLKATKWSSSILQSSPRSFGSKIMYICHTIIRIMIISVSFFRASYATMVDSEHYMKRKSEYDSS